MDTSTEVLAGDLSISQDLAHIACSSQYLQADAGLTSGWDHVSAAGGRGGIGVHEHIGRTIDSICVVGRSQAAREKATSDAGKTLEERSCKRHLASCGLQRPDPDGLGGAAAALGSRRAVARPGGGHSQGPGEPPDLARSSEASARGVLRIGKREVKATVPHAVRLADLRTESYSDTSPKPASLGNHFKSGQ